MSTVKEMLDDLHSGRVSLADTATLFAARDWQPPKAATDAEAWGEADDDAPGDDSWDTVNAAWWLTPEQYRTLSAAAAAKP